MGARSRIVVLALGFATGLSTVPSTPARAQTPDETSIAELREQARTLAVADVGEAEAVAAAPAGGGRPPHRGGGDVQVSQDQDPGSVLRSGASETALAVSRDGRLAVAGWNDAEGFGRAPFVPDQPPLGLSGYGYSSDGGRTWTDGGAPPSGSTVALGPGPVGNSASGRYVTRGDPWLDVSDGTDPDVYYANLGVWQDDPAVAQNPPAGISVHVGSFGHRGRFAWDDDRTVLLQSPNYPNDFLDKEALAVDGRGRRTAVYVTVTNFQEVCDVASAGFGAIELYRSLDAGRRWSRTIIHPDETFVTDPADPACGQDGVINQGSMPAVGPDGEVYVAWERGEFAPDVGGAELDRATIAFRRSTDRGASFSAPVEVASICSGAMNPPSAYNRTTMNDFPRIAVAQSGRHRGRIYVSYHDCSAASGDAPFGSDTDAYVIWSDDRGATWSRPQVLHRPADGWAQIWPVVSVDALGGVHVTYYEMRDVNLTPDPSDVECRVRTGGPLDDPTLRSSLLTTFSDVQAVSSFDGGRRWGRPRRVTDVSTNWCAATPINSIIPNYGDYITSVSPGIGLHTTWADGRNAGVVDRVPTTWYERR